MPAGYKYSMVTVVAVDNTFQPLADSIDRIMQALA